MPTPFEGVPLLVRLQPLQKLSGRIMGVQMTVNHQRKAEVVRLHPAQPRMNETILKSDSMDEDMTVFDDNLTEVI